MSVKKELNEFISFLDDLINNHRVNGNTADDTMIRIFEDAKELENKVEKFRKEEIRDQLRERAKESGEKTEDGRPLLRGEEKEIEFYTTKYTTVLVDELKEFFKDKINGADTDEERNKWVETLFDLTKSFSVTSIRDFNNGFVDQHKPEYEDHIEKGYYWATNEIE